MVSTQTLRTMLAKTIATKDILQRDSIVGELCGRIGHPAAAEALRAAEVESYQWRVRWAVEKEDYAQLLDWLCKSDERAKFAQALDALVKTSKPENFMRPPASVPPPLQDPTPYIPRHKKAKPTPPTPKQLEKLFNLKAQAYYLKQEARTWTEDATRATQLHNITHNAHQTLLGRWRALARAEYAAEQYRKEVLGD